MLHGRQTDHDAHSRSHDGRTRDDVALVAIVVGHILVWIDEDGTARSREDGVRGKAEHEGRDA